MNSHLFCRSSICSSRSSAFIANLGPPFFTQPTEEACRSPIASVSCESGHPAIWHAEGALFRTDGHICRRLHGTLNLIDGRVQSMGQCVVVMTHQSIFEGMPAGSLASGDAVQLLIRSEKRKSSASIHLPTSANRLAASPTSGRSAHSPKPPLIRRWASSR